MTSLLIVVVVLACASWMAWSRWQYWRPLTAPIPAEDRPPEQARTLDPKGPYVAERLAEVAGRQHAAGAPVPVAAGG